MPLTPCRRMIGSEKLSKTSRSTPPTLSNKRETAANCSSGIWKASTISVARSRATSSKRWARRSAAFWAVCRAMPKVKAKPSTATDRSIPHVLSYVLRPSSCLVMSPANSFYGFVTKGGDYPRTAVLQMSRSSGACQTGLPHALQGLLKDGWRTPEIEANPARQAEVSAIR